MKRMAVALPIRPRVTEQAMGFDLVQTRPPQAADYRAAAERLGDLAARAIVIVLFSIFAIRFGSDFLATGRLNGLLLLISESLVVALTMVRRSAFAVDRSMRARLLTGASVLGPMVLRPSQLPTLAPELLTVAVSAIGLGIAITGKLTLGRSFALMPANRGVVSAGVYRIVRHPIYSGYLMTHVAFLAANPQIWNIVALVAADIALLARAVCEEQTLARDEKYREYQQKVRWRVLPGLF